MLKESVNWVDFEKLDIRVGTVVEVLEFPEARRPAYKLSIDFGDLGVLKSSAQITKNYTIADLINIQVIAIVNFSPKQIGNFMSQCLVLGLYTEDGSVVLIKPERHVFNGAKLG
ncbi:MAG: tRNA-binding protein [Flavobacteriales bacterium]